MKVMMKDLLGEYPESAPLWHTSSLLFRKDHHQQNHVLKHVLFMILFIQILVLYISVAQV